MMRTYDTDVLEGRESVFAASNASEFHFTAAFEQPPTGVE
jgi:hypothetical protein